MSDPQTLHGLAVRARTFREAARMLEDLVHCDDAVNVLDNVASGIERDLPVIWPKESADLRAIITRVQNATDLGAGVARSEREAGFNAAMDVVRVALGQTCPRCGGSGIDPEFSSPGCTDPDRGVEPPALEPCGACQFPTEAEIVPPTTEEETPS